MKKIIWIAAFIALLTVVGIAVAHGQGRMNMNYGMHEAMGEIMEEGSYEDLVAIREKVGFNMMPWVTDQESFEDAKDMHKSMGEMHKNMHGNNGFGMGMKKAGMGCHQ